MTPEPKIFQIAFEQCPSAQEDLAHAVRRGCDFVLAAEVFGRHLYVATSPNTSHTVVAERVDEISGMNRILLTPMEPESTYGRVVLAKLELAA